MVLSLKRWKSRSSPGIEARAAIRTRNAQNPFTMSHTPFAKANVAGWSSPVARQAHNLKVTGSNPVPATIYNSPAHKAGLCRVCRTRTARELQYAVAIAVLLAFPTLAAPSATALSQVGKQTPFPERSLCSDLDWIGRSDRCSFRSVAEYMASPDRDGRTRFAAFGGFIPTVGATRRLELDGRPETITSA